MGMFDSLYEGAHENYGREWQTKAFQCNLDTYCVGDEMPPLEGRVTYQVEIFRHTRAEGGTDSLATVVDGVLVSIDNERAHTLPLFNYSGHSIEVR